MVNLDALAAFLTSERAPAGCMDLSELDGFLAGIVAGPTAMPPEQWLAVVWDDDPPGFADPEEAAAVMDAIAARFREIADGLDATEPSYSPIFWEDAAGGAITEDWAAGFMQAVALQPRAWHPVLASDATAALLIPIAAVAGLALPPEAGGDLAIPDPTLDRMIHDAPAVLPNCVLGLRAHWRGLGVVPAGLPVRRHH